MTRNAVSTPKAPALGPYSAAVRANGFVYLSGQTPMDPSTGKLAEGGIDGQTRQCFANLKAVLEAAGLGLGDVVKVNVYLADMADFAAMNAVYETQFAPPHPARTTIGAAALPFGARVEIEMVAAERQGTPR